MGEGEAEESDESTYGLPKDSVEFSCFDVSAVKKGVNRSGGSDGFGLSEDKAKPEIA
jgi:hypothetical protein